MTAHAGFGFSQASREEAQARSILDAKLQDLISERLTVEARVADHARLPLNPRSGTCWDGS